MKMQDTQNSHNNLGEKRKKKQSWGPHIAWFQNLLLGSSNQNNVWLS